MTKHDTISLDLIQLMTPQDAVMMAALVLEGAATVLSEDPPPAVVLGVILLADQLLARMQPLVPRREETVELLKNMKRTATIAAEYRVQMGLPARVS